MGSTGNVSAVEYLQTANDSLLTIVQIETKEALENVCLPSAGLEWIWIEWTLTIAGRGDCKGARYRCLVYRALGSGK